MRTRDSLRRRGSRIVVRARTAIRSFLAAAPLFSSLLVASGCACPAWTQTHSDPRYPEARYLLGVGSSSKKDATKRQDEAWAMGLNEIGGRVGAVDVSLVVTEVTSVNQDGVERSEARKNVREKAHSRVNQARPVDSCYCGHGRDRTFFLLVAAPNPDYKGPLHGDEQPRRDSAAIALVASGAAVLAAGVGLSVYGLDAWTRASDPDNPIDLGARENLESQGNATVLAGVAALNVGAGLLLSGAIKWALGSRAQRTALHFTGTAGQGGAFAGVGGTF